MKKFFPSLQRYKNIIFADNAGGSQAPEHVYNSLTSFIVNNYVQPGASNFLSKKITNHLEDINNITNIFFNNKNGKIIYGGSCTQLVYNLSNSLENYLKMNKGEIILPNFSHESCVSPFERIANKNNLDILWWELDLKDSNNKFKINYIDLLNKVNENTSLVVLPHVSNILGNILDIKYLINEIKKINSETKVLVDGVAYFPHGLLDVDTLNVDYYVVSFYKFCGLRISALYIKEDSLNIIENVNHYFFNNTIEHSKKLELGGVNFECASSILGVRDYLLDFARFFNYEESKNSNKVIKFDRTLLEFVYNKIFYYEKIINNLFKNFFNESDEIQVIECLETTKVPIYSLVFKNYHVNNINLILNELGIITKTGSFYCNRLMNNLKIDNNGVLRISLMHYNAIDDATSIIETLKYFKKFNIDFQFTNDSTYKDFVTDTLRDSFYNLEIDKNYTNKRSRAYSLLNVEDLEDIKIIGNLKFFQSTNYNNFNGNIIRDYNNIDSKILQDECFKYFVKKFIETINDQLIKNSYYEKINYIQVHQIRVYTDSEDEIDLVPEGIHQDGYNFIAMCCVTRRNISGAISHIYDESKNIVHSVQLQGGEMLIVNDNKMFHSVSPIKLNKTSKKVKMGYRDILVFTTIS